ncbi:unnamed protein product, partial [Phaeothamnion confervicola]
MAARFAAAADLVIEPGRASYAAPGTAQAQTLYFGGIGTYVENGITATRLGFGGPAGDALRIYEGTALGPFQPGVVVADALRATPDYYRFDLATPSLPDTGPRDIPGINVAADANPAARDAFGLQGSLEDEGLSAAVKLTDFNGDRESDLLVHGNDASYVLLGPV